MVDGDSPLQKIPQHGHHQVPDFASVGHSILHRVLMEYFSIADKSSAADVIQQLSGPLLVRMIHTRDGSKIGMLCVKHGSAKERKKIIKGMKGHIGKIAHDQCGTMTLDKIGFFFLHTKRFSMKIKLDKKKKILSTHDRGIGMTEKDFNNWVLQFCI